MTSKLHPIPVVALAVLAIVFTASVLIQPPAAQALKTGKRWIDSNTRAARVMRGVLGMEPKLSAKTTKLLDAKPNYTQSEWTYRPEGSELGQMVKHKEKTVSESSSTWKESTRNVEGYEVSGHKWAMRIPMGIMWGSMGYMFGVMIDGSFNPLEWGKGGGMNHGGMDHGGAGPEDSKPDGSGHGDMDHGLGSIAPSTPRPNKDHQTAFEPVISWRR